MNNLSFEVCFETDNYDTSENESNKLFSTSATLRFYLDNTVIGTLFLNEPHIMSSKQYLEMCEPGNKSLVFTDSNGCIIIYRNEDHKMVSFEANKYGNGAGGKITIYMPCDKCEYLFKTLAKWRQQYEIVKN